MSQLANERVAWFNGEFMPEREVRIPFRDSSWVYGDGCFDMTRTFGHRLFKVKEHVDRLYRSLRYLRIDPGFGPDKMCAAHRELFSATAICSAETITGRPAHQPRRQEAPATTSIPRQRG